MEDDDAAGKVKWGMVIAQTNISATTVRGRAVYAAILGDSTRIRDGQPIFRRLGNAQQNPTQLAP